MTSANMIFKLTRTKQLNFIIPVFNWLPVYSNHFYTDNHLANKYEREKKPN